MFCGDLGEEYNQMAQDGGLGVNPGSCHLPQQMMASALLSLGLSFTFCKERMLNSVI